MITIIGAGPIGCYVALLLSKKEEVVIYEQKKEVGRPIQCTGILTETINEIIRPKKEFIANRIYSARIFAPNSKQVQIDFKKPNLVVHRELFDKHFLNLAEKSGAKVVYNHQLRKKNLLFNRETGKTKKLNYNKLIGADGPNSKVSSEYGFGKRRCLVGVQALIRKKNEAVVDFYPHIGEYAWAVPESDEILRVGIAAKKNPMRIFNEFSKKYKGKIIAWQGGLIPLHDPNLKTSGENIFLVGDAAAQIKNTTGGGLVPGLMAAEELSRAITEEKNYEKLWRKRIGVNLRAHYLARNIMNRFSEDDWNRLIGAFEEESLKEILSKESRDKPISIIRQAIIRKPSLLQFASKLL